MGILKGVVHIFSRIETKLKFMERQRTFCNQVNNLEYFLGLHNARNQSHRHWQTNVPPPFRLVDFLTIQIDTQVDRTLEACHLCLLLICTQCRYCKRDNIINKCFEKWKYLIITNQLRN